MVATITKLSRFKAKLRRPADSGDDASWAFVVLPKTVSAKLARRGRVTVQGALNGHAFRATLDPDGQLSHWLKVDAKLLRDAGLGMGDMATLEVAPVEQEPEPRVPADLCKALAANADAYAGWKETTAVARLDWIHWLDSSRQAKTRAKRIASACDMLASGKRRVCCFDPSGYYSKAFHAPEEAK